LDLLQVAGVKSQRAGTQRFLELVWTARADQGHDVLASRTHPRDRDLRGGGAFCFGDFPQAVDQLEGVVQVLAAEAWEASADVAALGRALDRVPARDQPTGEHAVRGDRDTQCAARTQDLVLD